MTFANLAAGEAIFLDANPFVYHFVSDPRYGAACSQLLQCIENQEIRGLRRTKENNWSTSSAFGRIGWASDTRQVDQFFSFVRLRSRVA